MQAPLQWARLPPALNVGGKHVESDMLSFLCSACSGVRTAFNQMHGFVTIENDGVKIYSPECIL